MSSPRKNSWRAHAVVKAGGHPKVWNHCFVLEVRDPQLCEGVCLWISQKLVYREVQIGGKTLKNQGWGAAVFKKLPHNSNASELHLLTQKTSVSLSHPLFTTTWWDGMILRICGPWDLHRKESRLSWCRIHRPTWEPQFSSLLLWIHICSNMNLILKNITLHVCKVTSFIPNSLQLYGP